MLIDVEEVLMGVGEMGREREHSWLDTSKFLKLSVRLGSGSIDNNMIYSIN